MSETLEREKWIQQIHFSLSDRKAEPGVIYVDVEWALKEVEKEAEILFQYRKEDGKWTKVEADVISGTIYHTTIPLSIKDPYIYQIPANGSVIKGSEMEYIPTEMYHTNINGMNTPGTSEPRSPGAPPETRSTLWR